MPDQESRIFFTFLRTALFIAIAISAVGGYVQALQAGQVNAIEMIAVLFVVVAVSCFVPSHLWEDEFAERTPNWRGVIGGILAMVFNMAVAAFMVTVPFAWEIPSWFAWICCAFAAVMFSFVVVFAYSTIRLNDERKAAQKEQH